MDISVADTVESVRQRVKLRMGIGDNEFDNWRIAELDRHPNKKTVYLEAHRGDPTVENRYSESIVTIDGIDSLICYLTRDRGGDLAVDSSSACSKTLIPTLGFEHLRRRGNRSYVGKTSWGRNKELKIKR